ncbi:Tetraacyldisaccharide 4'-kinase [uncultured Desulfobacterium sp.]|uniref:Tetraacyldisaccharide 4'-kinase n=1 Tax=uncultured Desulfobacterium sp. TaxID=201089 RepID=A0A445N487_9BACT|nr:Tetraacyldisaccharide 4'-kinase [uncultured Desulfobacterium sp.]
MSSFGPDWSVIHQDRSVGLKSLPLALLSVPYGLALGLRPRLYSFGMIRKRSLPGTVISIGNLTVGGTGKTPAVAMVSRWAKEKGFNVAILSRGYGGVYKGKVLEVSDGKSIKAGPRQAGDEPYLLAKRLPGVPLVISKMRYLAGLFAHEKFGSDFFILDDGFQHIALKRDLDVVLIDAVNPFGNGHLLPWGPLREPVNHLVRADVFIITRAVSPSSTELARGIEKFPSTPVFFADHRPSEIVFPCTSNVFEASFIKGKKILAFAGIANPRLFRETLIRLGADVVFFKGFKDHYQFKREDLSSLIREKEGSKAQYMITTEKDWMRISSLDLTCRELAYLAIEFVLLSDNNRFFDIVEKRVMQRTKPVTRNL